MSIGTLQYEWVDMAEKETLNVNTIHTQSGQKMPDNFHNIYQTIAFFGEYLKEKS